MLDFSALYLLALSPISEFVPLSRPAISLLVLLSIGYVVESSVAAI